MFGRFWKAILDDAIEEICRSASTIARTVTSRTPREWLSCGSSTGWFRLRRAHAGPRLEPCRPPAGRKSSPHPAMTSSASAWSTSSSRFSIRWMELVKPEISGRFEWLMNSLPSSYKEKKRKEKKLTFAARLHCDASRWKENSLWTTFAVLRIIFTNNII